MERLQKSIANAGVMSRRKAEEAIKQGKVKVNGNIIKEMGFLVSEKDIVEVNNQPISKEEKVYYLMNKPRGIIVSTSDDKKRKTVVDLVDTPKRIYPVGRLDYDTTGALILTNDGEFANLIMHPSNNIDKVYIAKVEGIANGMQINTLKDGVVLDDVLVKGSRVKLKKYDREKNYSIIEITIHEGKNHQIKRMLSSVGLEVLKLKRERIAFLDVNDLKSGEYRYLTPKEIRQLYVLVNK